MDMLTCTGLAGPPWLPQPRAILSIRRTISRSRLCRFRSFVATCPPAGRTTGANDAVAAGSTVVCSAEAGVSGAGASWLVRSLWLIDRTSFSSTRPPRFRSSR